MAFEHYVRSGNRLLRCGYTTGTCAALAAAGAAELLLTGHAPEALSLRTPKGWVVEIAPEVCRTEGDDAICCILVNRSLSNSHTVRVPVAGEVADEAA